MGDWTPGTYARLEAETCACITAGAKPVPDELRLALFALHQQATVGPCTEAKPWGWNVVESAKWESWNQLGNMSSVEAMRLYVKLIEEEQVPPFIWQASIYLASSCLQP